MPTPATFIGPPPSALAWPLWLQITLGVIAGVVTLVTILANISVLYAFARTRRLHTYANYYIISLASVDLYLGIVSSPVAGANWALGYWPFGDTLCFVRNILSTNAFHTSYLSTLVIALDRYFSIAYPLKHLTYRTTKVASVVIFLTYAIPVAIWWPFTCYWRWIYDGEFPLFTYICLPRYLSSLYATVFVIVTLTWLPMLIMVVVYVKVYRIARGRQRRTKQFVQTTDDAQSEAATSSRIPDVNTIQVDLQPGQSGARVNPVFTVDDGSPYDEVIVSPRVSAPGRGTTPYAESGKGGMTSDSQPASSKKKNMRGSKALRTLMPIFIAMMASGIPWAIIAAVWVPCSQCIPGIVTTTAVYLARVSGAMNPFCYAIANPLYRQGILRLVPAKKKQQRQ